MNEFFKNTGASIRERYEGFYNRESLLWSQQGERVVLFNYGLPLSIFSAMALSQIGGNASLLKGAVFGGLHYTFMTGLHQFAFSDLGKKGLMEEEQKKANFIAVGIVLVSAAVSFAALPIFFKTGFNLKTAAILSLGGILGQLQRGLKLNRTPETHFQVPQTF